jgi:hypothetical protein
MPGGHVWSVGPRSLVESGGALAAAGWPGTPG